MKNIPSIRVIKESRLDAVIHTKTKREAIMLVEILGVDEERLYDKNDFIECWDGHKENTCYRIRNGKVDQMDCVKFYQKINEEIYEFSDLFATGGVAAPKSRDEGVSIHDLDMTSLYRPMNIEIQPLELVCNEEKAKEIAKRLNEVLARHCNAFPNDGISAKNGGKNSMKFTFYVTEGTRPDKNPDGDGKGVIPTMTTEVLYKDNDGCANGGSATCDKADYNERQGCLEAIANAVLGGNFDREYEKFLADKKRKYNESCKCKICGRNYYEDEKTGKRTPFTPEDARKHEEWHEQNKKNKRERYLLRKRAKEIAFEEQAQKMAKEMIKEDK